MPIDSNFGSFAGRPIQSALAEIENFAAQNLDPGGFLNKANSFRCPIGEEPGQGWLLMLRGDLRQISTSGYKTLVLGSGSTSVTLSGIVFVKAHRLVPGASLDDNSLYLVEVADKRWLARQIFCNTRYNTYSQINTSGFSAYTWTQLVQDLWTKCSAVIGAYSSQFVNPTPSITSTPGEQRFDGTSAWAALCSVCRQIGCEMRYDPIGNAFKIVQMGNGTATSDAANFLSMQNAGGFGGYGVLAEDATVRNDAGTLLEDAEVFFGDYNYPESVQVCFPREWSDIDAFGTYHVVQVLGSAVTAGGSYSLPASAAFSGTSKILFDPLRAQKISPAANTPNNDSALTSRANEVANNYYRALVDNQLARLVFSGARYFIPGPFVSEVTWREYGDGMKTEVRRWTPPDKPMDCCTPQKVITWGTFDNRCSATVETIVTGSTSRSAVQRILAFGPLATSGSVTITDGTDSGSVAYNASAAAIQATLEGFASIGAGNVTVSGSLPSSIPIITFGGALANTAVPTLTITGTFTTTNTVWLKSSFARIATKGGPLPGSGGAGTLLAYNRIGDIPASRNVIVGYSGSGWDVISADAC